MATMQQAVPVLTALDVPATVAFWVSLGFSVDYQDADFATLSRDGVALFISSAPDQIVPDNTQAWLRVDDVDALHADWSTRMPGYTDDPSGAGITKPGDVPWGREFAVRDVAGNCVHVMRWPA